MAVNTVSRLLAQPPRKDFHAVIKSGASAADGGQGTTGRRGQLDDGSVRTTERGAPLDLGFLDLAFGEAALAADLITA